MSSYVYVAAHNVMFFLDIKDRTWVSNQIRFKSTSVFNTVKTPSVAGPERPVWNTLLTYVSLPFTLVPFRKGHLNMLRIPFKEIPSYVCESTRVCVGEWVRAVRVLAPRAPPPPPSSPGGGVFFCWSPSSCWCITGRLAPKSDYLLWTDTTLRWHLL